MSLKEEGRKSVLSVKTDDSDWSDIDTDAEDGDVGSDAKRLKIDIVRFSPRKLASRI
jgi:hypothetical protein